MPGTESDRDVAAVARLDLVAPPAAPAATTSSSSCATDTATARDEDEEDGFTFAAVDVAEAIPRLQDDADDSPLFPDSRIGGSPVYPVFGRPRRSLSLPKQQQQEQDIVAEEEDSAAGGTVVTARRVSLERLLLEEQWSDCAPSASGQQQQGPVDAADAGAEAETYTACGPPRAAGTAEPPVRRFSSGGGGGGESSTGGATATARTGSSSWARALTASATAQSKAG